MLKLKIKQTRILCVDFLAYREHMKQVPRKLEKNILINFKNPQLYHRFFYCLLKFYKLAGYNVYFPMSFTTYRNLRNKDPYLSLLVKEKRTVFINPKLNPVNYIEITDEMISEDYFEGYFQQNNNVKDNFYIPMSFHPLMYHLKIWNTPVSYKDIRHNALFTFGNFDEKEYLEIKKTYFKTMSRHELHEFFKTKSNYVPLNNKKQLLDSNTVLHKKFIFATKDSYWIEMQDVRPHLALFDFFLCCPGVVKPICHNVVEAMSVGTIPVIEKEYAELLYPNLEHRKNAIIFNDFQHLQSMVEEELFSYLQTEIQNMRQNVFKYYNQYLSPEGMINNLNKSILLGKKIYLQAGLRSVKFKTK